MFRQNVCLILLIVKTLTSLRIFVIRSDPIHIYKVWMVGQKTCDFKAFSTVFQSYQDNGQMIMKDCVQWNPFKVEKISPRARDR